MKILRNDKYLRLCVCFAVTVILTFTCGLVIFNLKEVFMAAVQFLAAVINVFAPLMVALVVVLFLNNLVRFYDRFFKAETKNGFRSRRKATALTYITLGVISVAVVLVLYKKFDVNSISSLTESINSSVEEFTDLFVLLKVKLAEIGVLENVDGYLESLVLYVTGVVKQSISNIGHAVTKTGSWALNTVIGFTIAFYFLSERDRIIFYCKRVCDIFLPKKEAEIVKTIFGDISETFAGYISGQFTDAFIMAVLISVCFYVVGIPYALVVGVISGFSNLIPYFGAITAFCFSVVLGLMSGTPIKALYAAIIVILLQQIDSIIITPKVVGKSVKLHPVLVIAGLSVFGNIFGIAGMVFAVPVTALLKHYIVRLYEVMEIKKITEKY